MPRRLIREHQESFVHVPRSGPENLAGVGLRSFGRILLHKSEQLGGRRYWFPHTSVPLLYTFRFLFVFTISFIITNDIFIRFVIHNRNNNIWHDLSRRGRNFRTINIINFISVIDSLFGFHSRVLRCGINLTFAFQTTEKNFVSSVIGSRK